MASRMFHEFVKRLFSPLILPIRHGPLRGKKWILTSGIHFWRGDYEPEKTQAIEHVVRPGDVVFDIGAHVGYYTVLMAQIVGDAGQVIAFEPRKINRDFLKRHLKVNRCANVTVREACVGEKTGPARLETRVGTGTGHVSAQGNVPVAMVALDDLVAQGELPLPDFIKMDVEGNELGGLTGATNVIETARPRMIIATHGDDLVAGCQAFLTQRGYTLEEIDQSSGDREWIAWPGEE